MQRKILFVDDETSLRRTMALGLSQQGYETEPCENGMAALKKLESYVRNNVNLDGVVVDLRLPDIDGIKLAKIIKFKYPGLPVILITGFADRYDMEEIKGLKINAFMEKPVTADELTQRFTEIAEQEQAVEAPAVSPQKVEVKSHSAYMLLKLEDDTNFFEIYEKLYYKENVLYCDATKGDYDIFLLVQAQDMETLKEMCEKDIKSLEGVKSVDFMELGGPLDDNTAIIINAVEDALTGEAAEAEKTRDLGSRVCSYLLMEIEPEKLDTIYPTLRLDENVVFCDYTSGKYNLVLFVTGAYFGEIDKFIQEKAATMDGVLKVKEYPIVSLFEM